MVSRTLSFEFWLELTDTDGGPHMRYIQWIKLYLDARFIFAAVSMVFISYIKSCHFVDVPWRLQHCTAGVHMFTKNLGAASKFWAPKG
jgi:hypothetical protein